MNIPHHVAIIPDGNRRWAREHDLPTFEGHKRGYRVAIDIGRKARQMGIKTMTFWAFSTENWDRSQREVGYLMKLYEGLVDQYLKEALKEEIRIIHLGRKDRITKILRQKLDNAEKKTIHFSKYYLCVALDYGGRNEVVRAINKIPDSRFPISKINEENFNQFLDTKDLPYPDPDLIIRPGGEQRLSGLMIWQAAYAEYIFLKKFFPDFTTRDFENCIKEYSSRQRRFGK